MKMKMNILIFLFAISVLTALLLTGCNAPHKKTEMNEKGNPKMLIYKITRDSFDSFLLEPDISKLKELEPHKYTLDNEYYLRYDNSRFTIKKTLVEFVTDKEKIEKFISNKIETFEIQDFLIFEAPNTPMTMCIKSEEDYFFVTINENPEDGMYVYRTYTFSDYKKKFGCINALLKVQDKYVKCDTAIKMYQGYADVPFVEILKFLDINLREYGEEIIIDTNSNSYRLNEKKCELFKNGIDNYNILYQTDGGYPIIYYDDETLMVDTISLISIFEEMDLNICVHCDKENKLVSITKANIQ